MNNAQLNILLLALGFIQGIFLLVLLFKKRKKLAGYSLLAAYLFVIIAQISLKIASKIWLMENMRPVYSLSYHLPLLYGPLAWLFVRRATENYSLRKLDLLHGLPFLSVLACFVFGNPDWQIPTFLWPLFDTKWAMILQLASLFAYHGLAFYTLKRYATDNPSYTASLSKSRASWLRQFIVSSWLICSIISVTICLMYYRYPHWQNVRFGFIALTIFVYWISYKAWSQPELFDVIRGNAIYADKTIPALTIHRQTKKYSNSGLRESDMQSIMIALENKLEHEKCFLDPLLTIDGLAASLSCTRHHLSQAFNEKLGRSFSECISHYRVEEAKFLLADPLKAHYKIASIAYDSGFNSLSAFNEVFKKITGSTPSQFRKEGLEKTLQKQRV